jgi:hypothetical protein
MEVAMPRYKIAINEIATYYIIVTADSSEKAEELAEETFLAAPDFSQFECEVDAREVFAVETLDTEEVA